MFIFRRTAPLRCDHHPGLKNSKKPTEGWALGGLTPSTRHLSPQAGGHSCYLADIYQSVTAFCIQTHLDIGDYTDPRALERGQGRAPAPEQLTTTGAGRGHVEHCYQRAVTCHGHLKWALGSKD